MHKTLLAQAAAEGRKAEALRFISVKLSTLEFLINIIWSANPFLGSGRYLGERGMDYQGETRIKIIPMLKGFRPD